MMLETPSQMKSFFHLPSILDLPLPAPETQFLQGAKKFLEESLTENQSPQSRTEETKVVKGLWSAEEDKLLVAAVNECHPIVWDVVAEKVPGRNAIQCRERWRYRLAPNLKKSKFETWEDQLILSEQRRIGNKWTLIANKLPGRTACAVKNRWYSVLRNLNPF